MRITPLVLIALTLSAGPAAAQQKETENVDRTIAFSRGGTLQAEELLRRRAGHRDVRQRRRHPRGPDRHPRPSGQHQARHPGQRLDDQRRSEPQGSRLGPERTTTSSTRASRSRSLSATNLQLQVFSSDLIVRDTTGDIDAHTFSGNIDLDVSGASAAPDLKAETFSGDIKARVPQGSNGRVAFNTFSGDLRSDLPLMLHGQIAAQRRRGSRRRRRLEARVQDLQRRSEAGQVSGVALRWRRCASVRPASSFSSSSCRRFRAAPGAPASSPSRTPASTSRCSRARSAAGPSAPKPTRGPAPTSSIN